MDRSSQNSGNTAELLRSLFEATAPATGDDFFRALVRHLATTLEVRQSFVSELAEIRTNARTLAVWNDGNFIDNLEYPLAGTPCELVLGGDIVQIHKNFSQQYPGDTGLIGMRVESYLGIPLIGNSSKILGHVVAMDDKPMVEKYRDFSTLEIFAARATAELERRSAELKLVEKNKQLQQLLQELQDTQTKLIHSEKMASLGKLVSGFVHEINTPVGALNGATDIYKRSITNIIQLLESEQSLEELKKNQRFKSSVKAFQDTISLSEKASERIKKIVDSLKSFVRLDQAEFQKTDIHEGLEKALILSEHLRNTRIKVIKKYGQIPPIACYPTELNQVFMSLLENAAQAIQEQGSITIRTFAENNKVSVEVADTGHGIPKEQIRNLFDPAFSDKGPRVKAGLGLFIAHNVIRKHLGEIHVESELGKGSTFTITLPTDLTKNSVNGSGN